MNVRTVTDIFSTTSKYGKQTLSERVIMTRTYFAGLTRPPYNDVVKWRSHITSSVITEINDAEDQDQDQEKVLLKAFSLR